MTYDEWREKKANEKTIQDYLEKAKQREFSEEQLRESVLTSPIESIVDSDSV